MSESSTPSLLQDARVGSPADDAGAAPIRLTAWERISFHVAHAVSWVLVRLLGLPGFFRFARAFGGLEYVINFKRRRRFRRAIARVLGQLPPASQVRRMTREYFVQSRCDKMFYLIVDMLDRDQVRSLLSIEGRSQLDAAMTRGRGVYMAMSHHGAHHVIAMLMTLEGYLVAGVRDRNESGLRRFVQRRFDERHPDIHRMRVIFSDSYPRDIYRCLRDGYLLGSAMDVNRARHERQKTEEVVIFGERRSFLSGPLRVAIRCRTPVFQAFVCSEPGFHYCLDIVECLYDPDGDGDVSEDALVARAMGRYAANVESRVRACPALLSRL